MRRGDFFRLGFWQSLAILVVHNVGTIAAQDNYKIPNVKLELFEGSFRLSIPDAAGIRNVAFNVNRNRPFASFEQGEYSLQISEPIDGRWRVDVKRMLSASDTLYVWTNVQHQRRLYMQQAVAFPVRSLVISGAGQSPADTTTLPATAMPIATTSTTKPSTGANVCVPSSTMVTSIGDSQLCKDQLLFEENFAESALNDHRWQLEVRHLLYSWLEEFVLFNDANYYVSDGQLGITPTLAPGNLKVGRLDLGPKCTLLHAQEECELEAALANNKILPPVHSALLHTRNSFNFMFGRIEIRAKLPKGDWLFPYVLLQPVNTQVNSQIRIAYVRGNVAASNAAEAEVGGTRLYGGIVWWRDRSARETQLLNTTGARHFGDDFHTYELNWQESSIALFVDGRKYGEIIDNLERFRQKFYIVLGVSAGGHVEFNEITDKPWTDTSPRAAMKFWTGRQRWHNTWTGGSEAMIVDWVRVYAV